MMKHKIAILLCAFGLGMEIALIGKNISIGDLQTVWGLSVLAVLQLFITIGVYRND